MARRNTSVLISLFLLVLCASTLMAKSHTPRANTKAAVKAWVESASKLVAAKGAACDALKTPEWSGGDYYIFVVGPDDRLVCHPTLAGKMASEIVDSKGKKVGDALVAAGKSKAGHGWVDYVWARPGQTTPVPKSSYAMHVTGPDGKSYIVGGGGYELK